MKLSDIEKHLSAGWKSWGDDVATWEEDEDGVVTLRREDGVVTLRHEDGSVAAVMSRKTFDALRAKSDGAITKA